jgi:DUF4097 and DUF4098 domain-containing protein YvlB
MPMKAKSVRVALLSTLIVLGVQTAAIAERFTERFEETYNVAADVSITLGNTNGSISISIWDQDSVELIAEKRVDARNAETAKEAFEELKIVVDEDTGRLEIKTEHPSGTHGFFDWISGRSSNASVRYELKVPRQAELVVRTVNGRIITEGSQGKQKLRSTNGRIEVFSAAQQVDAHTTNGSINVGIASTAAPEIELGTTNGSITLHLPSDTRGTLEARTTNGSVKTDVPVSLRGTASRKRLQGDFNGGDGGHIVLRTTNGSIRIVEA